MEKVEILLQNVEQIRDALSVQIMDRVPSLTEKDCQKLSIDELKYELEKIISIQGGGA